MERGSPVGQLLRMTAAARFRVERGFERPESLGRRPLRRERARPMPFEKGSDFVRWPDARRGLRRRAFAARGEQGAEKNGEKLQTPPRTLLFSQETIQGSPISSPRKD